MASFTQNTAQVGQALRYLAPGGATIPSAKPVQRGDCVGACYRPAEGVYGGAPAAEAGELARVNATDVWPCVFVPFFFARVFLFVVVVVVSHNITVHDLCLFLLGMQRSTAD